MKSSQSHLGSAGRRFPSFFSTVSPIRYGVAAIIVLTLAYSFLHIFPMVRRDLRLLQDLYTLDVEGITLESDLHYEVQANRLSFLRLLLASGVPAQVDDELRLMRESDAAIAKTQEAIAQLGAIPEKNQHQFRQSWADYVALRDRLLASAKSGDPAQARKIDDSLGSSGFLRVERAVQIARAEFRESSAAHIREISATLTGAQRELFVLVGIKIAVLSFFVWMDWKRIRLEKALARTTKELKASEDRFRQAYETASVGMGIFKIDGTVLSANRMAAQILGCEVHELIGKKVSDFMAPEFREDHLHRISSLPLSSENSYQVERRVLRKDGSAAWVRNSVTLLKPEGGEAHYFSISEEITLQKEANDRLAYLANYDPVTNLPNRRHFEEQLILALHPTGRNTDCVALLYLEIDSFDFLKGTFGRNVADEVLGELGASLTAFLQQGEIVARLDDHVFAMLFRAAPYDEATMARATELRDVFHLASEAGKHRIPLSASIGIAFSEDRPKGKESRTAGGVESDREKLLKYARAAMLEARSRGGDSIYVADPGLQERAAQRHQIESALLRGLREDEFRVVFQPQFEVATGRLVRFEALSRWTSAELGTIPPDRFIPIAEQTGLIMEIGRRVLHEALRQAKSWTDSGRRIGVAVNISPMQFMRPDFTYIVTEALALSNFPPALLELEITEGIFIRDLNLAVARIRELQRLGLSIALDDFGTGYSSLSYLQRMPIDAVKLDRSFVSDLTSDDATVSMVRSVLSMANALNLRVVTEGVETEEQLDILRTLGCDEAQGYLLGRPESADMALKRVLESPLHTIGTLA
jgi:PAS domain S-box-containing protein/diguanylate cyclase (GGDEF)-like protein